MSGINKWIIELVCRWYVFIFLTYYGLGKIAGMQFYRRGKLPEEVADMTLATADGYSIAWTFMGYSFAYILFVGVLQIIGAGLLLWNRTKLFGVLILLPIMTNIIVFDLIFLDKKGAVVNAAIYFLMLLNILRINKPQVLKVIKYLSPMPSKNKLSLKNIAMVTIIIAAIFMIDQFLVGIIGR